MMNKEMTFGQYLRELRRSRNHLMPDIAELLNISIAHMSDIEQDRKAAPCTEQLDIIADFLKLTEQERDMLFDLAKHTSDKSKSIAPEQLMEYFNNDKEKVRAVIRSAKKYDIDDDEWRDFIKRLDAVENSII